eukprot:15440129-Alexandrium_andersonii.AAC.1
MVMRCRCAPPFRPLYRLGDIRSFFERANPPAGDQAGLQAGAPSQGGDVHSAVADDVQSVSEHSEA